MALEKGIWDPKLRGTNIKGTNLKSLTYPWFYNPLYALIYCSFYIRSPTFPEARDCNEVDDSFRRIPSERV